MPWPQWLGNSRRVVLALGCQALLVAGGQAAPAGVNEFERARAGVAASAPAGVSMELKLPKTRYYQGEIIPATLVFNNQSGRSYHTWVGTYDRSGRIPSLGFRAVSAEGEAVPDPLKSYFEHGGGMMGGGLGNDANLGRWEITLPLNQWLRFDHPGTYRLYGWSRRVVTGDKDANPDLGDPKPSVVELVSQVIEVEIVPLTDEQEQAVLAEAREGLTSDKDDTRHEAIEKLRYLQTPTAHEALLPLVGQSLGASLALAGAADPAAEADRIVQVVRTGRVPLNLSLLELYPMLRQEYVFSKPEALLAAAKATLQVTPWTETTLQTLLTLCRYDQKDLQTQALLIEHQTELPDKNAEDLLEILSWKRSPRDAEASGRLEPQEFLPLVRLSANAPRNSARALKLLARMAPDEARKLVVDDIRHPPFRHRVHFGDPHWGRNMTVDLQELLSLPAGVRLPELDDTLRERLRHPTSQDSDLDEGIDATMLLTARYGSPALLPDMLRVYLPQEGHWHCAIQQAALQFWLRCDPAAGTEGVRRVLYLRQDTACYHTVLSDVLGSDQFEVHDSGGVHSESGPVRDVPDGLWGAEMLPLVLAALDDESEEVWKDAAEVLALHAATPAVAARIIATAERLGAASLPIVASDRNTSIYRQNRLVALLLQHDGWQLTREQLVRLSRLPNNTAEYREKLARRLAQAGQ